MPYQITVPDNMVPTAIHQRTKAAKTPARAPAPKAKRKPNAWAAFCKAHMHDKRVQAVPPRQRFGVLSKMYKARQP